MRIEIVVDHNDLERTIYEFWLKEQTMFLDRVAFAQRDTKRHSYKIDNQRSYARLDNRYNGIKEEPDVPIEVSFEAVQIAKKSITFKKWRTQ